MIAYLDTSVLLRFVLGEPGPLADLRSSEALVSSELLAVESLRTIDRLRLRGALTVEEAASRRATVTEWLEAVDLVLLQRPVLARASGRERRKAVCRLAFLRSSQKLGPTGCSAGRCPTGRRAGPGTR